MLLFWEFYTQRPLIHFWLLQKSSLSFDMQLDNFFQSRILNWHLSLSLENDMRITFYIKKCMRKLKMLLRTYGLKNFPFTPIFGEKLCPIQDLYQSWHKSFAQQHKPKRITLRNLACILLFNDRTSSVIEYGRWRLKLYFWLKPT